MIERMDKKKYICSGCNVYPPHEHRCHGTYYLGGQPTAVECQCEQCKRPTKEALKDFMEKEGLDHDSQM